MFGPYLRNSWCKRGLTELGLSQGKWRHCRINIGNWGENGLFSCICLYSFLFIRLLLCCYYVLFICNVICCLPAVSVYVICCIFICNMLFGCRFLVPFFYVAMLLFGWAAIVAGELLSQRFSRSDGRPSRIKHGSFTL